SRRSSGSSPRSWRPVGILPLLRAPSRPADRGGMVSPSRRLGEFLVDRKVLSRDDLEAMLAREAAEGVPLPRLLVSEKLVAEKDLVAAVADQVGIPFVDFTTTPVHPEADRLVPAA